MYSGRIETCSSRLARALSIRGISQTELCKATKIPKSSLSLYLSGAYEPKQDRLYAIALVLDIDPVWLMGYDVPMERQKDSPPESHELTEGERVLLELFSKVPEDKQSLVIEMIRAALKSQK